MSTTASTPARAESAKASASTRVVSIDIFRGLTMAVMIFVNALAEVRGMPWWTYHAHVEQDLMTYVDMVFPFFLFIVGMSLPLSVAHRLKRGASMASLWLHVASRVISLLVIGLILANAEKADAVRIGMNGSLWGLLGLICCGLYLNVYPRSEKFPLYASILRGIGLVGAIVLLAIFRRVTRSGEVAWLDFSYPEILGLIAYSYLVAAVLYISTRRIRWMPALWFVLMILLCIGCASHTIPVVGHLPWWKWPFSNGAMVALIMAGVMTSQIFLGSDPLNGARPTANTALLRAAAVAVVLLIAGWICVPLGISKIRATPSWTLWCAGAAMLAFAALYWICDVQRKTSWAVLFRPAGANTLLTYLLPDLWFFAMSAFGITWYDTHFAIGLPAVVKTIVFTIGMLLIAGALTRARLRLQL